MNIHSKFQVESALSATKSSSTEQIMDLKLELVKTKRKLAKSEAEGSQVAEEKKALMLEYDRARAEFGTLFATYEAPKKVAYLSKLQLCTFYLCMKMKFYRQSKKKTKELPELEATGASASLFSAGSQVRLIHDWWKTNDSTLLST